MEFINQFVGTGLLWCSLFILALMALIFWPEHKKRGESALDVLHKKFAEGSLSVEQYQERKSILEQDRKK
jgi:uncharacterized membrane protein